MVAHCAFPLGMYFIVVIQMQRSERVASWKAMVALRSWLHDHAWQISEHISLEQGGACITLVADVANEGLRDQVAVNLNATMEYNG